ncbi:MAG: ATP-binding cassette domain-containing protein [Pseudolabrys sp.]|nr:ATP-binding cassette domain-containing protein [Pseudolabrys sp.]
MRDISGNEDTGASSTALVRRLAKDFIRPHVGMILLAFVCMSAGAGSTALRAWLTQPMLDRIFLERQAELLFVLTGAALGLAVIKGLADYGDSLLMGRLGQRVIADVQKALYAKLIRADIAFFNANPSGTLISRFTADVILLRGAAANVLVGIGKDAVTVVFLVALMFYQDWLLALVSCAALPLAIRPVVRIGRRMRQVSANTQLEYGQLTTLLSQTFQGARHVKAYGMEAYEQDRADALFERLFRLVDRANRTRARASPMMEALGGAAIALVTVYGGYQVINGARTPGALFAFLAALLLAYQPLKALANLNATLQEGLAAAQRLFEVLDIEPNIRDVPHAKPLQVKGGEIRFDHVRFGYQPPAIALDDITVTVAAGSTLALVGPSGAGKSTVLNLIPRFYDVSSGSIVIDGQDIRGITLASLRAALALVAQEASLFDDTMRANIAYGRLSATNAEIEAAAAAAGADRFIAELPQGYDTLVGEQGIRLSGGQRQRLAIARAMLKDAPILLLDEATSALDNESERQVQAALKRLMSGRTTLVIAHRLSTIVGADLICVMDKGRIVESGRHAQLLARGGLYARLYETQFAAEDAPALVAAEARSA